MTRLDDSAITERLGAIPGWTRTGDALTATYDLASFAAAISFVVRVGFLAEQADHHPDLDIRWKRVRVLLTSHDAGGITERDFALAREIEQVAT